MTQRNERELSFDNEGRREVVAEFSGAAISSDGGALLLREADRTMNLLTRFSRCFRDKRNPVFVQHRSEERLAQRVYGLALGYEDLNDHEPLRTNPLLACWPARSSRVRSRWRARAR